MDKKQKENEVNTPQNTEKRRSFLKKAAYSVPTLVALGQIVKPSNLTAGFGGTPSDTN